MKSSAACVCVCVCVCGLNLQHFGDRLPLSSGVQFFRNVSTPGKHGVKTQNNNIVILTAVRT
jgi:hypothetical protein